MPVYDKILIDCQHGRVLEIAFFSGDDGIPRDAAPEETPVEYISGYRAQGTLTGHVPPIAISSDAEGLLGPLRLREWTRYEVAVEFSLPRDQVLALRDRAGPSWPFSDPGIDRRVWHLHRSENWPVREIDGGWVTRVTGVLNFGSHVGLVNLTLETGREIRGEVVPSKLTYEDDFRELLFALSDIASALVLHLEGITTTELALVGPSDVGYRTRVLHFRRLMARDRLPSAMARILSRPHNRLATSRELEILPLARDIDLLAIAEMVPDLELGCGGPLAKSFRGCTPRRLPVVRRHVTSDTPENRFVRYVLEEMFGWLRSLAKDVPRGYTTTSRCVEAWTQKVEEWLQEPLFRDIGRMTYLPLGSIVLQRRAGYRQFLEAYLSFALGLKLEVDSTEKLGELAEGNLRPIYRLYEYWCFLKLAEIVERISGHKGAAASSLIKTDSTPWELRLVSGPDSLIEFDCGEQGAAVEMWYNRDFSLDEFYDDSYWSGAYTGLFHPDVSLRIVSKRGPDQCHWVHFDAKYRLDRAKWEALLERQRNQVKSDEKAGVYERGDLYTMHTYRDAILGSRGSYVLYPGPSGSGQAVFVRNPSDLYRDEHEVPSVGAFPLAPGARSLSESQELEIEEFLRRLLRNLAGSEDYVEEAGIVGVSESVSAVSSDDQEQDSRGPGMKGPAS